MFDLQRSDNVTITLLLRYSVLLTGLYFDGKKSKVRQDQDGAVDFPTIDHYTMISQPDKKYCGFCKCDGTGM